MRFAQAHPRIVSEGDDQPAEGAARGGNATGPCSVSLWVKTALAFMICAL